MGQIKFRFLIRMGVLYWVLGVSLLFGLSSQIRATDYYFSNSGNDQNSGTTQSSPWQSASKIQQTINTLNAGDRILLERGSVWHEVELSFNGVNGSSSNPIRIEAFGSGARPVLSGGKLISNFTNSGNVYSATVDISFPRESILVPGGVLIDGEFPDIARSEEFFAYGGSSWTQLTDNTQSWSSNELTGGIVIFQPVLWSWCSSPITSNTATTLDFHRAQYSIGTNKWTAYYVANLDQYLKSNGAWTFRDNTLKIYSDSDLNQKNVQFAVIDSIIAGSNSSNISFKGIAFDLANYRLVSFKNSSDITFDDCEFSHSGGTGLKFFRTTNLNFVNNYVHHMAAMGILTDQCNTPVIRHNLFKHIAAERVGLGNYTFRFGAAVSNLTPSGDHSYVEYNYFDSVGLAIQSHTFLPGRTCSYSYNYIENHGMTVADCAAIYAASDWDATVKTIQNNIIKNAVSSGFRYMDYGNYKLNPPASLHPHALYVDEAGYGYHCDSNSIEKASGAFYTNRSHSSRFTNNNVVDGNYNLPDRYNAVYKRDLAIGPQNFSADRDEVQHNNIVMNDSETGIMYLRHSSEYNTDAPDNNLFYFDHNKIANPYRSSMNVGKYLYNWGAAEWTYTLEQLQSNNDNLNANVSDENTVIDPQGIKYSEVSGEVSKEEFVKFYTNFSAQTRTVDLGNAVFRDIDGNTVSGSTTVPPFYSKILFYESGDINSAEEENYIDEDLVPFLSEVQNSQVAPPPVNHKPNVNSADYTVLESTFSSLNIGQLAVTDADAGQNHTFSIISGNELGLFTLTTDGILSFASANIDFTGDPEYNLIIRVVDNGTPALIDEAQITIRLFADVSETNMSPEINPQSFEANYDMVLPQLIGIVSASDPNPGQELSYEIISGNQEDLFSIDPQTGEIHIENFPQSNLPGAYDIIVMVSDNGQESMQSQAVITVNIQASALVYYIDPDSQNDEEADGSFAHPFSSWAQVEWIEGGSYLQKRGTVAYEDKILVMASNVELGEYGTGPKPVLNSSASDYAIKVMEKGNVKIRSLEINADAAIGCIYFIGAACVDNSVVNCDLKGADYGLRIIDGSSYIVKYNLFSSNVDGIYSIADFAEIYYNIFKGNHKAINLSSYSSSAQIYNNVFFDNRQGVSTSHAEISLMNNIFYMTEASDQAINHSLDKLVSNHNIFYPEQTGFIQIEDVSYNTLAEYRERHGLDLNSYTHDPMFVDVYNDNFTVQPESKAVDGGRLVGLIEDFLGQVVPSGDAPDIGLVELANPSPVKNQVIDDFQLQVFPNPSEGVFTVSYTANNTGDARVNVFTLSGSVIYSESIGSRGAFTTLVNISDSPSGVYFVTVTTDDGVINRKIVKK